MFSISSAFSSLICKERCDHIRRDWEPADVRRLDVHVEGRPDAAQPGEERDERAVCVRP